MRSTRLADGTERLDSHEALARTSPRVRLDTLETGRSIATWPLLFNALRRAR